MTLGQEFTAFGHTILEDVRAARRSAGADPRDQHGRARRSAPASPRRRATRKRCARTCRASRGSSSSRPPISSKPPPTPARSCSCRGVLKRCAVKLSKICNDLRLLESGPRAGFGEINLPAMQPGSSIMPGKVNPVIPEVVNQVCFDIIGGDVTVTMAAEAGQLQLNVFEPIIAFRLLARHRARCTNACVVLRERCVDGHHGESGAHALVRRAFDGDRHRARADASATSRSTEIAQRGARDGTRRLRAGDGAQAPDARGARPRARTPRR